jgi:dihydroorotate dehydrogenase
VVTSGIAWRTRRGTPPALAETPAGVLYVPGTATLGVDAALRRYARRWAASPVPVVVNLRAGAPDEFTPAAAQLEGTAGILALELDLASPADDLTGPIGHDPALVRRVLADVRRVCGLPLLVKLPADAPDPAATLRGAAASGAVGATLGAGWPALGGRLVGPATFPLLLDLITRLAPDAPLPILAGGGVCGPAQAAAYLRAGAAGLQVGSAHLANPLAAVEIQAALTAPDA